MITVILVLAGLGLVVKLFTKSSDSYSSPPDWDIMDNLLEEIRKNNEPEKIKKRELTNARQRERRAKVRKLKQIQKENEDPETKEIL